MMMMIIIKLQITGFHFFFFLASGLCTPCWHSLAGKKIKRSEGLGVNIIQLIPQQCLPCPQTWPMKPQCTCATEANTHTHTQLSSPTHNQHPPKEKDNLKMRFVVVWWMLVLAWQTLVVSSDSAQTQRLENEIWSSNNSKDSPGLIVSWVTCVYQ